MHNFSMPSADTDVLLEETLDEIVNPDCGFYYAFSGYLMRNSTAAPVSEDSIASRCRDFGLYHLRIGLEDFSANAGGVDAGIDANAVTALQKTLSYLKKYQISAIIRFCYNVQGLEDSSGRYLENEPKLSWIKKHIATLGAAIAPYSDVIIGVESGMVGPWGEQHSTQLGSADKSNAGTYYAIVEEWLNALPEEIGVTVRRPKYFCYWANSKYGLKLNEERLGSFSAEKYPEAQRVGVYNDGYLGSETDWGTFTDRRIETAFIGRQAEKTLYGGEVIADKDTGGMGYYNNVDYLEQEAFITHTSYLNISWNYERVISQWERTKYDGDDSLYRGRTSDFTFVKNRLGYRLVLQSASLPGYIKTGNELSLSLQIQNKGFASLMRAPVCSIVFQSDTASESVPCSLDLLSVRSQQSKTLSASVTVPAGLKTGEYKVYVRCETSYGRAIRFANDSSRYSSELQANLLGEMRIEQPVVERDSFLVVFDGNYGTLVEGSTSQIIKKGESAVAPTFTRKGYVFVGWDVDFSVVTQDLNVMAIWRKEEAPKPEATPTPSTSGCGAEASGYLISAFLIIGALCVQKRAKEKRR